MLIIILTIFCINATCTGSSCHYYAVGVSRATRFDAHEGIPATAQSTLPLAGLTSPQSDVYVSNESCHISAEHILSHLDGSKQLENYNSSSVLDAHKAKKEIVSVQEFYRYAKYKERFANLLQVNRAHNNKKSSLRYPDSQTQFDFKDVQLQLDSSLFDVSAASQRHKPNNASSLRFQPAPVARSVAHAHKARSPTRRLPSAGGVGITHARRAPAAAVDDALRAPSIVCYSAGPLEKENQVAYDNHTPDEESDKLTREKLDEFSDYIIDEVSVCSFQFW